METKVLLIRHGVTSWHDEGRVLGRTDIPLSDVGVEQAKATAGALADVRVADLVSSPLQRAIQTAEIIEGIAGISTARDPRFTDFDVGRWGGMTYDRVSASSEYQRFLADPYSERIPGGESLSDVRDRAVGAVEQAVMDCPTGDAIVIVTHAGIIRVLLTHYLGSNPANYHRIRVSPGSISALAFASAVTPPRVLAVNYRPNLAEVL